MMDVFIEQIQIYVYYLSGAVRLAFEFRLQV